MHDNITDDDGINIVPDKLKSYYDNNIFRKKGIQQIYISEALKHFDRIKKIYGLIEYKNDNIPLLVFGVYNNNDYNIVEKHGSTVYILWGGTDADDRIDKFKLVLNKIKLLKNVYHYSFNENIYQRLKKYNIDSEKIKILLTDQIYFPPLEEYGDCIYIYDGYSKGNALIYSRNVYLEVIRKLPGFRYILSSQLHGIPNEKMCDVYKNCFIGLRLTINDGLALTVQEFISMNIPIIHNGEYEESIKWKNSTDIINTILSVYNKFTCENKIKKIVKLHGVDRDEKLKYFIEARENNEEDNDIYDSSIYRKTFSVIMPVYNNKITIVNSIKSIIDQTYDKWELIIVDDCSIDGTY